MDTSDIWPGHASARACHACAPARRYRTPAALGVPPALSPGGPLAPSAPSPDCAGGFAGALAALRAVPRWRSRVFSLVTRRSLSLVTSANRDSAARLSASALDRRASRLRSAASAPIANTSHAPARYIRCCCSTLSCTAPLCPRRAAVSARSAGVAVRGAF